MCSPTWSSNHLPTRQLAFLEQVEKAGETLAHHPSRGGRLREVEIPGLRQLIVGSYRLIYRVEGKVVGIVRLIHGRRDLALALGPRR